MIAIIVKSIAKRVSQPGAPWISENPLSCTVTTAESHCPPHKLNAKPWLLINRDWTNDITGLGIRVIDLHITCRRWVSSGWPLIPLKHLVITERSHRRTSRIIQKNPSILSWWPCVCQWRWGSTEIHQMSRHDPKALPAIGNPLLSGGGNVWARLKLKNNCSFNCLH